MLAINFRPTPAKPYSSACCRSFDVEGGAEVKAHFDLGKVGPDRKRVGGERFTCRGGACPARPLSLDYALPFGPSWEHALLRRSSARSPPKTRPNVQNPLTARSL